MVLRQICEIAMILVCLVNFDLKCLEMIPVELACLVSCDDFFMRLQSGAHQKTLSYETFGSQACMTSGFCFHVLQVVMLAVLRT